MAAYLPTGTLPQVGGFGMHGIGTDYTVYNTIASDDSNSDTAKRSTKSRTIPSSRRRSRVKSSKRPSLSCTRPSVDAQRPPQPRFLPSPEHHEPLKSLSCGLTVPRSYLSNFETSHKKQGFKTPTREGSWAKAKEGLRRRISKPKHPKDRIRDPEKTSSLPNLPRRDQEAPREAVNAYKPLVIPGHNLKTTDMKQPITPGSPLKIVSPRTEVHQVDPSLEKKDMKMDAGWKQCWRGE